MLKKTISYTDYNGVKRTEDFMFNLTKAEIAEMEMNESQMAKDGNVTGGLEDKLDRIKAGGKGSEILQAFKDILFMAYGEKSEDGKHFRKSAQRSRDFAETEAYSELFMELISDADGAAVFMNGMLPADFSGRDQDKPVGPPPSSPAQRAEQQQIQANTVTDAQPTPEQIQAFLDAKAKDPNGPSTPNQA